MISKAASGAGKAAVFAFGSVSKLVGKVLGDEHIQAAGRQGVDELGAALKAFPDAIQAPYEPGSIFTTTNNEVAARRKAGVWGQDAASPAAKGHGVHGPDHSQGAHGNAASRTPSEIAADRGGVQGPEREHGQDNGQDNGHGR